MKNTIIIFILALLTLSFQSKKVPRDFSSPKGVVETFIKAGLKKDKNTLSICFSDRSPGEWNKIRSSTFTRKELKELKVFVSNATITGVDMKNEQEARVFVSFNSRDEKIYTIKENERWFILDF